MGRTEVLGTLKAKLFKDNGPQRVAIDGLGGVGKTQIALQLAYWVKSDQPECSVFWMPAQSLASFEQACVEIAKMVGIQVSDMEDAKQLVRQYLGSGQSGKWLLIVDNADDADIVCGTDEANDDGRYSYLPQSDTGRILFTSRSRSVAVTVARSEVVEVSQMSHGEAVEFLKKSLVDDAVMADEGAITDLLDALTYLPLAITQAAAYLNKNQVPPRGYVALMRKTDRDLMELLATEFSDDTRYRGSHNAVANTWIVSFEQIQRNPNAAALLSFISFIESKAIPRPMLPQAASEQRTTLAIGLLTGYSFLNGYNDGHTYDMHRLVHLASRVWVERQPDAKEQWRAAFAHLRSVFEADNREFGEFQLYTPHMFAAFDFWESRYSSEWKC